MCASVYIYISTELCKIKSHFLLETKWMWNQDAERTVGRSVGQNESMRHLHKFPWIVAFEFILTFLILFSSIVFSTKEMRYAANFLKPTISHSTNWPNNLYNILYESKILLYYFIVVIFHAMKWKINQSVTVPIPFSYQRIYPKKWWKLFPFWHFSRILLVLLMLNFNSMSK